MLRPYQEKMVNECRYALAQYRRIILQSVTGSGKTILASEIAKLAYQKGRRVLIISNRTEIFTQNGGAFERAGLKVDYINPSNSHIPSSKVSCGMAQTLKRRVERPRWSEWLKSIDFVFIDEAHCCDADFIFDYISDTCYVIGLTATPSRGGHQRQLGSMYHAMVKGVSVRELIDSGYLSEARHYSIAAPSIDDVEINYSTGDYNCQMLARKFECSRLYVGLVEEWLRLAEGRKTIVFCVSSRQAIDITKEFMNYGVNAKYLLSGSFDCDSTYSGERTELLDSFKRGKFDVLVNVGIAIAGLDVPDIGCVVLDYSTTSITKYLQSIGRGSRIAKGKKDFIVLDCGGNYKRFGTYDKDREWSLWHYEGNNSGIVSYKLCDSTEKNADGVYGCGQMVPTQCKVCPCCGRKFITEHDQFQMHLEEVCETSEKGSIAQFCAEKKLEGWNLSRIMVQVCLANTNNIKEAFEEAYMSIFPTKTLKDAHSYWYVWSKNVWSKVKQGKALK